MALDRTFITRTNLNQDIKTALHALVTLIDTVVAGAQSFATLAVSGASTLTGLLTATAGATFGAANTYKAVATLTAFATGGQTSATALTGETNTVTTVATLGDSVKLPTAALGKKIEVTNSGVAAMDVFGQTGASINGGAADAAYRQAPGTTVVYRATSATAWTTATASSVAAANIVTQGTSVSTTVVLNETKGVITTFSQSAAADASSVFTVTNSKARAVSNIKVYVISYAGTLSTNGVPVVQPRNRSDGAFDIGISNAHSTNALNGVLVLGFEIVP